MVRPLTTSKFSFNLVCPCLYKHPLCLLVMLTQWCERARESETFPMMQHAFMDKHVDFLLKKHFLRDQRTCIFSFWFMLLFCFVYLMFWNVITSPCGDHYWTICLPSVFIHPSRCKSSFPNSDWHNSTLLFPFLTSNQSGLEYGVDE